MIPMGVNSVMFLEAPRKIVKKVVFDFTTEIVEIHEMSTKFQ